MRRTVRLLGLIAFATGATVLAARPHEAAADSPCRLATRGDSPVAKACAEGGVVRAKQAMRAMVKDGRAAGVRYQCDDCHADDMAYEKLTQDAKDKFARLLAAVERKR